MNPQVQLVGEEVHLTPSEDSEPTSGTGEAFVRRHVLVVGDDASGFVTLEDVERRYILRVVEACNWNKSKAARILGIGRKTLYRRLEGFGIEVESPES